MISGNDNRKVAYTPSYVGGLNLLFCGKQEIPHDYPKVIRTPQYFLFHYIESGEGSVGNEEDAMHVLTAGDWFFCYPGKTIHYIQNAQKPWVYRWVAFNGNKAPELMLRLGISEQLLYLHSSECVKIVDCFETILALLCTRHVADILQANKHLFELASLLCEVSAENKDLRVIPLNENLDNYIENACMFMLENFCNGINVEDVCRYVGFERTYFSKSFSLATGHTIQQHLANIRLQRAKELLLHTQMTINEIAISIGYNQAKVFARFFHAQTGSSPGKWRKVNL